MSGTDAVRAAQAARFSAMVAQDLDALAELLAADLTYHHSNGRADTKASWLEGLRNGETRFLELEPIGLEVRLHGTTAIVTGTLAVTVAAGGERQENGLRFTEVWVEDGARWRLHAWQAARMPQ